MQNIDIEKDKINQINNDLKSNIEIDSNIISGLDKRMSELNLEMQKLKVFLVLTGYQLTWLACVFGETNFSNPMLGIWVGIIFLLTYF